MLKTVTKIINIKNPKYRTKKIHHISCEKKFYVYNLCKCDTVPIDGTGSVFEISKTKTKFYAVKLPSGNYAHSHLIDTIIKDFGKDNVVITVDTDHNTIYITSGTFKCEIASYTLFNDFGQNSSIDTMIDRFNRSSIVHTLVPYRNKKLNTPIKKLKR